MGCESIGWPHHPSLPKFPFWNAYFPSALYPTYFGSALVIMKGLPWEMYSSQNMFWTKRLSNTRPFEMSVNLPFQQRMWVTSEKPKWVHKWLMYFRDSCGWVHGDLVRCHPSEDLNKVWKSQTCHLFWCWEYNWSNWWQGFSSLGIVVRKRQALTWIDKIPVCSYTAFVAVSLTLRNSHLRNCLVIMIHFSLVMLSSFHFISL